jgi:hypothetical protein
MRTIKRTGGLQVGFVYRRGSEVRKILDSSAHYIVFLEKMDCKEHITPPSVSEEEVAHISRYRSAGGLTYMTDRGLADDWMLRSVSSKTFNLWLQGANLVEPQ